MALEAGAWRGGCIRCLLEAALGESGTGSSESERQATEGNGRTFGDYEIQEQIGRGGMAVVYKARQISLNRIVALKKIDRGEFASPPAVQRFRIEAEAVAKLNHPNIVSIYDVGVQNGEHYFSMTLVNGRSLAQAIRAGEFQIPAGEKKIGKPAARQKQIAIATLVSTLAEAVEYAHQHGVLHRDLKPGNILLDANYKPYITDFGLAKLVGREEGLTLSHEALGTPKYMSPEQATGQKTTTATDVYSLGVILYELLAGRPPFDGVTALETMQLVTRELVADPRMFNGAVDRDLATIALKCIEKAPARRYVSAAALAEDLKRWLRREPILARRPSLALRTRRWVERNPNPAALLLTLALALGGSLFLLYRVNTEARGRKYAQAALLRLITSGIYNAGMPQPSVVEISSEQLRTLRGQQISPPKTAERVHVGLFVEAHALETILGYGPMLEALERQLSTPRKPVRVDVKLYLSDEVALQEIVAGRVHFARIDPEQYLRARGQTNVVIVASEKRRDCNAVVFTRADSGITNLAELRGRSLCFWDAESTVTAQAKAILAGHGLCQGDFKTNAFLAPPKPPNVLMRRDYAITPNLGYMRSQGATVFAVMTNGFHAGVALQRQFRLIDEKDWRALATFPVLQSLWVCSAGTAPDMRQRLGKALRGWEPDSGDADRDRYRAGWECELTGEVLYIEEMKEVLAGRLRFDNCIGTVRADFFMNEATNAGGDHNEREISAGSDVD